MAVDEEKKAVPVEATGDEKDTKKKKGKKKEEEPDLSAEDLQLKTDLELCVERCGDPDPGIKKLALNTIVKEIKSSTTSMTSVPKPLKFLRAHYSGLKERYESYPASDNKIQLADILSVLAMTYTEDTREGLKFKLRGCTTELGTWGHEYVRFLAGEIGKEYAFRMEKEEENGMTPAIDDLLQLVKQIVPFFIQHNAEPEAVDVLLEVNRLSDIVELVDNNNYVRLSLYLQQAASYLPSPEDNAVLQVAVAICQNLKKYPDALRIALRMNDTELVTQLFKDCEDSLVKKQMAFIALRQQAQLVEHEDDDFNEIVTGTHLNENYLNLARDLDVMEPKLPEDVYKSHLEKGRSSMGANFDSARQNLAATFVNAFINAGFGTDKLMTQDGNKWLYKNKEHGMMSAAASMGGILLWDVDGGLTQIDKFLYSSENYIRAGALMAVGILNSGVRNDCDPALALLQEYVESNVPAMKTGAILGLGMAYAGTQREEVMEFLTPVVADADSSVEAAAFASLALGLVFVGSCHDNISQTVMGALMERCDAGNLEKDSLARFFCVGVGLLYLGAQDGVDTILELAKCLSSKSLSAYCYQTLVTCAYAGTGDVLKVQELLQISVDNTADKDSTEEEASNSTASGTPASNATTTTTSSNSSTGGGNTPTGAAQAQEQPLYNQRCVSVIGVALVAMGEELGSEMSLRILNQMLQYGDLTVRRSVPLALAMLCPSNPKMTVLDTLSKLSHDADAELSQSAILSLGITAAGTNNSRVATTLRQLASYYSKEPSHLFVVRLAQGLLHAGKGLLTLNPYHSDKGLMSNVAVGALLAVVHSCLDMKNTILGKHHYLLYFLICAMYPRMLTTLDENLQPLHVEVRVGQAVDVVGQAGRPKTITGFQTHNTPVLLGYGDRAELATEEYLPVSSVMEGFVILKKNPDYVPSTAD